jgi:peptide chain release factor 1
MSRLPLSKIINELDEINNKLSQTQDQKQLIELSKKQKTLSKKGDLAYQIQKFETEIADNKELAQTETGEMLDMLKEEIDTAQTKIIELEKELLTLLAPSDPRDGDDVYVELRAGAGGDESAIFAGDMLRAYTAMCAKLGFKIKLVSSSASDVGGFKEIIVEIHGENVYSWFKYEGGVHRVQRVPATEKQGRIHTSTVSVAIMPILDQNSDFQLDMSEVEVIASTSQGAGGQSVNTTYSAIQACHKPTGIRAQCQDERNQAQNKIKALEMLTSRVFDHYEQERKAKEYAQRKDQVGKADRSEKIRTYNYPQDRITDHRYGISFNNIPNIMSGDMTQILEQIREQEGELALTNLEV